MEASVIAALALALAGGAAAPVVRDPCQGQLDAAVVVDAAGRHVCGSAAHADAGIVADEKVVAPPSRDPAIFPGEIMMVSTVVGLSGGALLAVAFARDDASLSSDEKNLKSGAILGGASALSLAGLLAGAALSTYVFDVATGELRLPIFEGEPR